MMPGNEMMRGITALLFGLLRADKGRCGGARLQLFPSQND
jgi:hypothetical protein